MHPARPRIGFVGIGLMGLPMARKLLAAGYPLTAHHRGVANAALLAGEGARVVDELGAVAAASDCVLTTLPTPAVVREAFLGADGLVATSAPGTLLIDCSTVGPDLSRAIAAAARARGVDFLDAPVSGGTEGAAAGSLTIMVGGEAAAFERARPVLETLGGAVRHVGPSGAGSVVKLVNQLLTGTQTAAAAEAAVFARRAGADLTVALDIVSASYGDSRMFRRTLPRVIAGDYAPGGTIVTMLKDLDVITEVADAGGAPLPLGGAARALYAASRDAGDGGLDMAGVALLIERLARG